MRVGAAAAGAFCRVSHSFGSRAISVLGPRGVPSRGDLCTEIPRGGLEPSAAAHSAWPPPGVCQDRFIPPTPLPPFIKRSRVYAAAITICPRGAAPASSFPAAPAGGRFNPSLPGPPTAAGKGQHKDSPPRGGTVAFSQSGRKGFVWLLSLKKGKKEKGPGSARLMAAEEPKLR